MLPSKNTPAIVLTWNSTITRVLCPYECPAKVYRHSTTLPREGVLNRRIAECEGSRSELTAQFKDDEGASPQEYRLLYPFEKGSITAGFSWVLDRENERWRTTDWKLCDPEYQEHTVIPADGTDVGTNAEGDVIGTEVAASLEWLEESDGDDEDEITEGFAWLIVSHPERDLSRSTGAPRPSSTRDSAVIQRAHAETIDRLIKAESKNGEQCERIEYAIAKMTGQMQRLLEQRVMDQMIVSAKPWQPGERKIVKAEEFERTGKRLRKIDDRLELLKDLLQLLKIKQAKHQLEVCLQSVGDRHGQAQEQHVRVYGYFSSKLMSSYICDKTLNTSIDRESRTVACMYRGRALPIKVAVSGWNTLYMEPAEDTLDRAFWTDQVFKLAKVLSYDLPKRDVYDQGRPGSYYACHSEKQLLAYLVHHHTTTFLDLDESEEVQSQQDRRILAVVQSCEAPLLKNMKVKVFVCQPERSNAYICRDCENFRNVVEDRYGMTVEFHRITQNDAKLPT
ncbi:hypothetical protein TI39_contig4381g00002 [Zymoseptoria brevis]|uniref:Single-strand DNA deaminase toxin A-like C-terminal domain-containing protein n=1 Tax=Zymoseptoria brevis TaxID=1047168 RepID=A0A0F4GAB8_9PEZI|nr:hypothetical protein TI39_contig4381g00002 [Zymoseptoria brevis]